MIATTLAAPSTGLTEHKTESTVMTETLIPTVTVLDTVEDQALAADTWDPQTVLDLMQRAETAEGRVSHLLAVVGKVRNIVREHPDTADARISCLLNHPSTGLARR